MSVVFVRVCGLSELEEDTPKRVELDGTPISVVSTEGELFAIYDICSHANVSLTEGEVDDCQIECWLHGSRFDLRTGKPTGLPATEPVATFPVEVRDGDVYVDTTTTLNGVSHS